MSDDPNQTTSFQAKLPGGAVISFATKSARVLLGIAITAALVFHAMQLWDLRIKVEVQTFAIQAMARGIREQTCLQYLTEAERKANVGQAAACRKMGEMQ